MSALGNFVSGYYNIRMGLQFLLMPIFFALFVFSVVGYALYEHMSLEGKYRRDYGEEWVSHFESDHGSLSAARQKLAIGGVGAFVVCALAVGVYSMIMPAGRISPSKRKRKRRIRQRS